MLCFQPHLTHYIAVRFQKTCIYVIKVSTMKNVYNLHFKSKSSCATALFAVSKDEWDAKEYTGKFMTLYILQYAKRHLLGQSYIKQQAYSSTY